MMSAFAQKVKQWYALGLWSEARVRDAVLKGKLTEEEFREVTGKVFGK